MGGVALPLPLPVTAPPPWPRLRFAGICAAADCPPREAELRTEPGVEQSWAPAGRRGQPPLPLPNLLLWSPGLEYSRGWARGWTDVPQLVLSP